MLVLTQEVVRDLPLKQISSIMDSAKQGLIDVEEVTLELLRLRLENLLGAGNPGSGSTYTPKVISWNPIKIISETPVQLINYSILSTGAAYANNLLSFVPNLEYESLEGLALASIKSKDLGGIEGDITFQYSEFFIVSIAEENEYITLSSNLSPAGNGLVLFCTEGQLVVQTATDNQNFSASLVNNKLRFLKDRVQLLIDDVVVFTQFNLNYLSLNLSQAQNPLNAGTEILPEPVSIVASLTLTVMGLDFPPEGANIGDILIAEADFATEGLPFPIVTNDEYLLLKDNGLYKLKEFVEPIETYYEDHSDFISRSVIYDFVVSVPTVENPTGGSGSRYWLLNYTPGFITPTKVRPNDKIYCMVLSAFSIGEFTYDIGDIIYSRVPDGLTSWDWKKYEGNPLTSFYLQDDTLNIYVRNTEASTSFSVDYSDYTLQGIEVIGINSAFTPRVEQIYYSDILNTPTLPTALVAYTNSYYSLDNLPYIFQGNYNDLSNKPTLATVATTGNYNDLFNKPTIPTVSNIPTSYREYKLKYADTTKLVDQWGYEIPVTNWSLKSNAPLDIGMTSDPATGSLIQPTATESRIHLKEISTLIIEFRLEQIDLAAQPVEIGLTLGTSLAATERRTLLIGADKIFLINRGWTSPRISNLMLSGNVAETLQTSFKYRLVMRPSLGTGQHTLELYSLFSDAQSNYNYQPTLIGSATITNTSNHSGYQLYINAPQQTTLTIYTILIQTAKG